MDGYHDNLAITLMTGLRLWTVCGVGEWSSVGRSCADWAPERCLRNSGNEWRAASWVWQTCSSRV